MKLIITLLSFSILVNNITYAQNQLDNNGLRTGQWTGYYPDSTIKYEGEFIQGKPVGIMKRYDPDGILSITLNYTYPNQERCFATMYSPDGKIKAEGIYENRKKDSIWNYFGSNAEIRMVESYKQGVLDGDIRYYYHTGNISQSINYERGVKNGKWYKYFNNGDTMMVANYMNNELSGSYVTHYPDGKIQISGQYKNDLKDGQWDYFGEEGDTLLSLSYKMGEILNKEELTKSYEQFIQEIEKNEGNMPDPALEGY